jgi:hypothetical protein
MYAAGTREPALASAALLALVCLASRKAVAVQLAVADTAEVLSHLLEFGATMLDNDLVHSVALLTSTLATKKNSRKQWVSTVISNGVLLPAFAQVRRASFCFPAFMTISLHAKCYQCPCIPPLVPLYTFTVDEVAYLLS